MDAWIFWMHGCSVDFLDSIDFIKVFQNSPEIQPRHVSADICGLTERNAIIEIFVTFNTYFSFKS